MAKEELVGYSLDGSEEGAGLSGSLLGKYYMSIRLGPYKRPAPFEPAAFDTKKTIVLPLPQELRDDTSVSYENVNLESVGDLINGDIGTGIGAAVLRNSGKIANKVVEESTSLLGLDIVGQTVNDVLPADQITSALQQTLGTAPNPNPSVQFTGPELRSFAWTWTLLAANSTESAKIKRLVAVLKAASLPRNIIQNSGGLLGYPDMCQLNFYPWDMKPASPWTEWGWGENSIIRIKKCMISYVNALYTPSNTPAFFGDDANSPVAVQLSIGFKEIEYFVSEDWGGEGAYYTGGKAFENIAGWFGDKLGGGPLGGIVNPLTTGLRAGINIGNLAAKKISGSEEETLAAVQEDPG